MAEKNCVGLYFSTVSVHIYDFDRPAVLLSSKWAEPFIKLRLERFLLQEPFKHDN